MARGIHSITRLIELEIDALMKKLGGQLFTVIGPRAALKTSDPFAAEVLRKARLGKYNS